MVAAVNWAMAEKHLTVPNQIPCHKGMTATALKLGQSRTHVLFTYFLLEHNTERWWRGAEQCVQPWFSFSPWTPTSLVIILPHQSLSHCFIFYSAFLYPSPSVQLLTFAKWALQYLVTCPLHPIFYFHWREKRSWTRTYWVLFIAKGRSHQQQVQNM